MEWKDDLKEKVILIRNEYKDVIQNRKLVDVTLTAEENKLFLSMKRWHRNMHRDDKELISHLNQVDERGLLNVKEKMEKIPGELKQYLDVKFKKTETAERFGYHDLFDNVLNHVMKTFKQKLDDRSTEEFDLENIVCGIPPDDLTFYQRIYCPAAVFYTYKSVHKDYLCDEELMEDIFSIGGGSKCESLTPEITPYCQECGDSLSADEIVNINLNIFKCLKAINFQLQRRCNIRDFQTWYKDSTETEVHYVDRSKPTGNEEKKVDDQENTTCNYLKLDSESCVEYECLSCDKKFTSGQFLTYHRLLFHRNERRTVKEVQSSVVLEDVLSEKSDGTNDASIEVFKCKYCGKVFSRADFVEYHRLIYHQKKVEEKKKTVVPVFVEEGLDLMTTFCDADTPEKVEEIPIPEKDKGESLLVPKNLRTRRQLKYQK